MSQNVLAIQAKYLVFPSSAITRPANATQYAAGDVVSDDTGDAHHTFAECVRGGGKLTGEIVGGIVTSSTNETTKPDLELWLFHTDIADVADNAAFGMTDAELATLVGVVDFPVASWKGGLAGAAGTGNALCDVNGLAIPFLTADDGGNLYGQLVARNAYTPISGEILTVTLKIRQD